MLAGMNGNGRRKGTTKTESVERALLDMARQRGPGIKLPTLEELGAEFRVSRGTLERALQPLERRGLFVRRQGSGIYATAAIRLKTVGVAFGGDIFSPGFSPFWSLLLGSIRGAAAGRGILPRAYFDTTASSGPEGHSQLLEELRNRRLDGLLLFAPQYRYDEATELRAHGLPLVVFSERSPTNWSVSLDWEAFHRLAVADLARSGSRHVAMIAPPEQRKILDYQLRAAGLDGVRIDDWSYENWSNTIPGAGSRENCARLLTERTLADRASTPMPDTVVSLEDTATRGVVTALLDAGLRPGHDIRIVTAENRGSPVLDPFAAELHRIAFDPTAVVQAALDMLETLMDGGRPPENPARVRPEEMEAGRRDA